MIYRCIRPDWASPSLPKVQEGEFTEEKVQELNALGYNVYFLPNHPSIYEKGKPVDGSDIDVFEFVFVDFDLKHGVYPDKYAFIASLSEFSLAPTKVVDSGNGIHVYWRVSDLDAMSFLKLQRRLMRLLKTDEAVAKIYQLMRVPGTYNTKVKDDLKLCELLYESEAVYTCEQLDKALPSLLEADKQYCEAHYNKTYNLGPSIKVDEKLPLKFGQLLKSNAEVKNIWTGGIDDRSKGDYRLGHIMYASGFTKDEARSVLVNSAKALARAPVHRVGYAEGIIEKIWTFETAPDVKKLSNSVKDILARGEETVRGTRFPCSKLVDDTVTGFRLGHVIGLVAGSGVGKTAVAINMFKWFTEYNPDYEHFFVPLEQTDNELALRWKTICGDNQKLHEKVHILSNYDQDGSYRNLSLDDIKNYILEFQKTTGKKIGTCVIDHIGVLAQANKNGENQSIMDVCKKMKSFAVETNTLVVMQSQAPREKAGIGDLELNKDSAYGTVFFESFVDFLMTVWQPLKRCYSEGAPTVMAFKFCKIRHKKQGYDRIQEDVCYRLFFDPQTEQLREMTQMEEKSFDFFQNKCVNLRKKDRKTELVSYQSRRSEDGKANSNSKPV